MTYLQNNRNREKLKWAIIFCALGAILFIGASSNVLKNSTVWAYKLIFGEREKLIESREELALLNIISGLKKENKSSFSNVILGGGYMFSDFILISKGSRDGVKIGDNAVYSNIFLGKISETGAGWSRVESPSKLGGATPLRLGQNKEIVTEGEGLGGGEIKIFLPASLDIKIGDPVWWGGSSDLLAGLVSQINKRDGKDLQEIIMESPVDLKRVSQVEIIAK